MGEYTNGTIVKLWDDGNAYRIELDDADKTNVYAPIDVDTYVRSRPWEDVWVKIKGVYEYETKRRSILATKAPCPRNFDSIR